MAELKPRERLIAILAGLTVLVLVWMYAVVFPVKNYGDRLDNEIKNTELKLLEAQKLLDESPHNSPLKESLRRFYTEGSPQENMSQLIKEIETAATGAGLQVIETKPDSPVKNGGWFELKVNISFDGKWSDVIRFLYVLDNVPRPLVISEMSFETSLPLQSTVRGRLEIGRLFAQKMPESP